MRDGRGGGGGGGADWQPALLFNANRTARGQSTGTTSWARILGADAYVTLILIYTCLGPVVKPASR